MYFLINSTLGYSLSPREKERCDIEIHTGFDKVNQSVSQQWKVELDKQIHISANIKFIKIICYELTFKEQF
jgi:hypothetical protein